MHSADPRYCTLTRWHLGGSRKRVSVNVPFAKAATYRDSELEIKIVDTRDMTNVLYIRDLPKPPKHLSFHPSGSYLAVSCSDGIVYVYSISTEEPILTKRFDGLIRRLEAEDERSSRAIWHPDGRAFAIPTPTRDVQVISKDDGEKQRAFSGGHLGDITALAWSPNGALLATSASDRKVLIWDANTQKVIARSVKSTHMNYSPLIMTLDTTTLELSISSGILVITFSPL